MENILNRESVAKLRARAVEGYLEEIHDAFRDAAFDRLMRELSLTSSEIEAVRSFLMRNAIHIMSKLVLDALSTNAKDILSSEMVSYLEEDEKEVVNLLKKELTLRARGILIEDFDDATGGE